MTNVFTRKHHLPKSVTLLDYPNLALRKKAITRPISPTRCGNPHPLGLKSQDIPNKKSYLIWHPTFGTRPIDYGAMIGHMRKVNFSCAHPPMFDNISGRGKVPNIRYTENTTHRVSYINPVRFPALCTEEQKDRFACSPNKKAVTGIVPNLLVPEYLPVIEH